MKVEQELHEKLMNTLKTRFDSNMHRHKNVQWSSLQARLEQNPAKVWALNEMEKTGGQPDAVVLDENTQECVFCDCSPESPEGRRSLCYDDEALQKRKSNKPQNSAVNVAKDMGVQLLSPLQYAQLQMLEEFDLKTSSWVLTPTNVRALGGALFCDKRYNTVFTYHNGAESYYSARGFRAVLLMRT